MLLPPVRDSASDPPVLVKSFRLPPGSIRHPWLQALVVIALISLFIWVSRSWRPGPWNLAAILAIITQVAMMLNKGSGIVIAWFLWLFLAFATIIGNEAAAHLLFRTCLYD
jgi:hypothetical protein